GYIFNGFIDPSDEDPEPGPQSGPDAVVEETNDSDSDDDDDEESGGIDLTEVNRRFEEIYDANEAVLATIEKHGRASKQAETALSELASVFAPIKLSPKYFERLVVAARESLHVIRTQERQIMMMMTRKCGMDRKDFIK
ncbi:sigma-70 non-essential region-containing protein, partial [Wenyingzhuangia sp. 1_MG-2023]|nr:sigma-70 non-essential region-containing protein [Wenyingzhuangia sp. 1_MG-2023]